ncbi:hypothetical protein CBS11852_3203 [Aspergillus niger]|nr:hypothetical protein CBS11852_3203 [Aspergillus niger]KAI2918149.1 hypothetical protein CBS147371_4441 [Aspergillus niger]KAI2989889.1 hypothetical protein CBS147344_2877 [Aspergillus niger]
MEVGLFQTMVANANGLILAVLVSLGCWVIYTLYFHPLARIPGPKWWIISRIPYFRSITTGQFIHSVRALHERYGPVVRLAANEVSFTDPQAWQDIYGHHGGERAFPRNPVWYQPALNGVHHILSASNSDHARIRHLLSHAFSERALKSQEPMIQVFFNLLIERLRPLADGRQAININDWLQYTTFDITGELEFGESFGCLEKGEYHPWIKVLLSNFRKIILFGASQLIPGLRFLVGLTIPKAVMQQRQQHFSYTVDKVSRRLARGNDPMRPDFLTYINRYNEDEKKGMSRAEIDSTFNVLVIAGSETTSTCMTATLHCLLRNPATLQRLQTEIRSTFAHDSDITFDSTIPLRYLNAVIEESLRLCPPAPTMLPRVTPAAGAYVCGYWLPGGTAVEISQYAMSRSHANYGDPDRFIPERWLDDEKPNFHPHDARAHRPFSFGPRNCLGRSLAWMEIRCVLCKLLWNFNLRMESPDYEWNEQGTYVMWDKKEMLISLTPVKR